MPIQKDRNKDIPGKDGYSVRDIEKLIDVVKNYTPEPEDKDNCFDKLFQFALLVITFSSLFLRG